MDEGEKDVQVDDTHRTHIRSHRSHNKPPVEGFPPKVCDTCGESLTETCVDGKTELGPWG